MKFETLKFSDVTINYDKKRIPLSAMERIKRQGKYRYYGAQGIIDYIDDYIFDGKYLLIAEDGENLKSKKQNIAQIAEGKFWVNNHAHIVQCNDKCRLEYLCFLLNSMELSGYITGSAQPKLSQVNMNSISLILPSVETQDLILSVILPIEQKIALNTAINENLQEQAQAICEKWVSDHSQSIVLHPLAEIADINPDTYSSKEKWDHINYLDTSSITNGVISEIQSIRPDKEKLPSRARRKIMPNDIVYSTVRPNQLHFGIVSNPLSNMLASTGFAVIRSRYSYICSPFIYHFLTSPAFIEKMQQLAEQSTSTFPSVKPSDIGACLIPCTDEVEMCKISDLCNDIFAIISAIYQENQHLATLRDTLLPKLMSGEIDVSHLDL